MTDNHTQNLKIAPCLFCCKQWLDSQAWAPRLIMDVILAIIIVIILFPYLEICDILAM